MHASSPYLNIKISLLTFLQHRYRFQIIYGGSNTVWWWGRLFPYFLSSNYHVDKYLNITVMFSLIFSY